ncbi:MAG: adenylyltransferase/cytidyltransferase family protein [Candidatus Aminicenantes bacterium]|nr:adenylyltransferase/cytidyltransferase family protein [Candidatus Aminicenantes bacterium]
MYVKNKWNDQTIGFTSGVFDMFHIGHLNILRMASSMCDKLIVGVTVDELVAYKKRKVVIPFSERMEIIQNIKYVDLAIPQDDLDKYVMWKKLKFNVMFIGDDWYDTERFEEFEKKLSKVDVKIIYFPYTSNISTTVLKERLFEACREVENFEKKTK